MVPAFAVRSSLALLVLLIGMTTDRVAFRVLPVNSERAIGVRSKRRSAASAQAPNRRR